MAARAPHACLRPARTSTTPTCLICRAADVHDLLGLGGATHANPTNGAPCLRRCSSHHAVNHQHLFAWMYARDAAQKGASLQVRALMQHHGAGAQTQGLWPCRPQPCGSRRSSHRLIIAQQRLLPSIAAGQTCSGLVSKQAPASVLSSPSEQSSRPPDRRGPLCLNAAANTSLQALPGAMTRD